MEDNEMSHKSSTEPRHFYARAKWRHLHYGAFGKPLTTHVYLRNVRCKLVHNEERQSSMGVDGGGARRSIAPRRCIVPGSRLTHPI